MIAAAHQPTVLPYPGFWLKMDACDVWGWMPHVEFSRHGFTNRVRIGLGQQEQWFTIPVSRGSDQLISDLMISEGWRTEKAWKTLEQTYGKLPHWKKIALELEVPLYLVVPGETKFVDLVKKWNAALKAALGITCKEYVVPNAKVNASERLAAFAESKGCSSYLSGSGGQNYLNHEPFSKREIAVKFADPMPSLPMATTSVLNVFCRYGDDWREKLNEEG